MNLKFYFRRCPSINNKEKIKKLIKATSNKFLNTFSDITLLLASAYFLFVKKGLNLSLTDTLKEYIPDTMATYIIWALYACIFSSLIIKVIKLYCDNFKIFSKEIISPDGMKHLCLLLNQEITNHIGDLKSAPKDEGIKSLSTHHHFISNIGFIVNNLAEHLAESLRIKKKRQDVYISVYYVQSFEKGVSLIEFDKEMQNFQDENNERTRRLKYLTHWDSASTHRFSEHIDISSTKYEKYECVKAYKSRKFMHTNADGRKYYCGSDNPRASFTKNFLCFFIEIDDSVVGLVNIEFHNNNLFDSDDDMLQYINTDLLPFKYMFQYQFLKKRFFHLLSK